MTASNPPPQRQRPVRPSPDVERMPPDHLGVLLSGLLLAGVGSAGLYWLVTNSLPRIGGPLWLFFVLLHMVATGIAIPFIRYLNLRFTPIDAELPPGGVIVRQSVWVGLFIVTCAWLQIPRALSLPVAFFLALVFIVLEIFLRSRELNSETE